MSEDSKSFHGCSCCSRKKPESEFGRRADGSLFGTCKKCRGRARERWHAADPVDIVPASDKYVTNLPPHIEDQMGRVLAAFERAMYRKGEGWR